MVKANHALSNSAQDVGQRTVYDDDDGDDDDDDDDDADDNK